MVLGSLLSLTAVDAAARDIHVAPSGLATNDGSAARPLNLATALSASSPARPGDTIWLHGGIYRGTFVSYLTGTAAAPIIVRQSPNERAIIDTNPTQVEALLAYGAYTWYWGFEIMNSDPNRYSSQTGSWPSDLRRGGGITARGRALKFINLVIHDTTGAFGVWIESVDSEVYGNILYYNGWQAPDRAHGHAIYSQNQTGRQVLADNIIFDQFSHGLHSYGSDVAFLDNITMDGNISFNNGVVGRDGPARDLLLGGGPLVHNPIVTDNYTYGAEQVNVGYNTGCSNAVITGNYFIGSGVSLTNCAGSIQGNTMYSIYGLSTLPTALTSNTFLSTLPHGLLVRVRPNRYETGRANIAIYNWDDKPQVDVSLAGTGLAAGQAFEIRDAQNYFGAPIYSGIYNGSTVTLPMTSLPMAVPIGTMPVAPQHTPARFGAFVVVPVGSVAAVPAASLTASPASIASGGASVLTWSTANVTQVSIDPIGSVGASGSMTVHPSSTTTYTLTAQSSTGPIVRTAVVSVASNTRPTVSLSVSGGPFTAPASIALNATASDPDGSVARVDFYRDGVLLGTDTGAPYSWSWTGVAAGSYALTAVATDNTGLTTTSASVAVSVAAASGGGTGSASAAFVAADLATQGSWQGKYGAQGYSLFGSTLKAAAFATVSPDSSPQFTWAASTPDVRALQKVGVSGRVAATLYSGASNKVNVAVKISDGKTHRLAIYIVDFTRAGRAQTVEIVNTATGAVLDRRSVTSFPNGQYLVWTVGGNVTVRLTRVAGPDAVISAVFID